MTKLTKACFVIFCLLSANANAALESRLGGQAYYDTELNITWLANTNLAASNTFGVSRIYDGGIMFWETAQSWAAAMNAANYLGYNDWRLPLANPINGTTMNDAISFNGTTDNGYNISAPGTAYAGSKGSEIAYLYFNELGNISPCNAASSTAANCVPQGGWGLVNKGPLTNFPYYDYNTNYNNDYWTGTEYSLVPTSAWYFNFGGVQLINNKENAAYHAMVVRPGDSSFIAAVPEPATYTMLLAGLGIMGFTQRRRKNLSA